MLFEIGADGVNRRAFLLQQEVAKAGAQRVPAGRTDVGLETRGVQCAHRREQRLAAIHCDIGDGNRGSSLCAMRLGDRVHPTIGVGFPGG